MPVDEPAVVDVRLALRHRDVDSLGHVNQAVFHELLEEVRAAFFRRALPDLPFEGYVLVRSELDYKHEVRMEAGHVTGECRVADVGRSRVELENLLRLPDGTVAAQGRAVLVAWDGETRRSRALSQGEREALLGSER